MTKEQQFIKELEELCNKHMNDFGVVLVIETSNKDVHITGNLCPVCAKEYLEKHIEIQNIKHNKHSDYSVN